MEGRIKYLFPSIAQFLFVVVFLHLSFNVGQNLLNDGDTGIHIRAGEYMLETGSIPEDDPFSLFSPPLKWPTHEWLSGLIMASVARISGLTGVVVFFILIIALTYSMLFRMLRSDRSNIIIDTGIILFVLMVSQGHWLARPHVFTLFLLVVWYHILESFQNGRNNYLYALPLIMLVWINIHGAFILGFVLVGIYILHNMIKVFLSAGVEKERHLENMKFLFLAAVASLMVSLLNPKGFQGLLFPIDVVSNHLIMDNYDEFLSPDFHSVKFAYFKYFLLLIIASIGVFGIQFNVLEIVLLLTFTNMSLLSSRYIPLFAIVVAPILSRHGHRILSRTNHGIRDLIVRKSDGIRSIDESSRGLVWPVSAVLVVVALMGSHTILFAFDENRFPVAAVEFLNREQLPGNMFNNAEFGDYMIFAADPRYKVFQDSRADVYGNENVNAYLDIANIRVDLETVFDRYRINWVIFNSDSAVVRYLRLMDDWVRIYSDQVADIYVKNTRQNEYWIRKYAQGKSTAP